MSACEECWTEASRKAATLGGSVVDRYHQELRDHPEHSPNYRPADDAVRQENER